MVYDYSLIVNYLGISKDLLVVLIVIISIWTIIWKGLALWKSARKKHLVWFIIILIVNTIGILDILYIYIFSKWGEKIKEEKPVKKKR